MSKPYRPTAHDRATLAARYQQRAETRYACNECHALVELRDAVAHMDWHTDQKLDYINTRLDLDKVRKHLREGRTL
jgi:hypothetical protein